MVSYVPRLKASNKARTILTQAITETSNLFTVASTALFPDPPFRITVDEEIMEVGLINRVDNTFGNVQRGVENTAAISHSAGAIIENRFTAGTYSELALQADLVAHETSAAPHSGHLKGVVGSVAPSSPEINSIWLDIS